jgi:hypothetical protein
VCWTNLPRGETTAKARLYIHELFILKAYHEKYKLREIPATTFIVRLQILNLREPWTDCRTEGK